MYMATIGDYLKRAGKYAGIGGAAVAAVMSEPVIGEKIHHALFPSAGIEQRLKEAPKPPRKIRYPGGVAYAQGNEGDALPKTGTNTISDYNPREEFRKLGWEVYDEPGLPQRNNRTYMAKLTPDEFKGHLDSKGGSIRDIFSEPELLVLARILDGNSSNHEMRFSYVTTSGELALLVRSPHEGVGIKGSYYVFKKLAPPDANRLRMTSHSHR